MHDHLKAASINYSIDRFNELKLKPISTVDTQIIDTLITIVERTGNETLSEILTRWKYDSDESVLDDLSMYLQSEELEGEMKSNGGDFLAKLLESMKKSYINIGNESIHANKIFIISRREKHDGVRTIYSIIINDEKFLPPGTSSWYVSLEESFITKEDRDESYEAIKGLLIKNTMCKFLN